MMANVISIPLALHGDGPVLPFSPVLNSSINLFFVQDERSDLGPHWTSRSPDGQCLLVSNDRLKKNGLAALILCLVTESFYA